MTDPLSPSDPLNLLGEARRYADGSELFQQDAPATSIYRIVAGVVRTSRLAEDGRRQIGDFHFAC